MGNHSAERIGALVKSHKTLLANASHELRSPLARLRLGLESIQEAASDGVRQELARNIAELDQLIEEMLLASRLGADSIAQEPFDDVDLTGLVAEECARMEVKFDGEMATLQGNPKLLRRMVRNLLDNARRHGTGSAIEASLHKTEKHVLELRVCDRGPGIPNAAREKIFEPFYRLPGTKEREGGMGLGLALVRQIATHHLGTVKCEPRIGGGSCFIVEIPISPARNTMEPTRG